MNHQDLQSRFIGITIEGLLRPCAPQAIRAHPVGPAVNNAGNESPALIRPLH